MWYFAARTSEDTMTAGNPITEIDALTNPDEDKICIVRDHETGDISWRFANKKMGAIELMAWTSFYAMMTQSGYRARIEELEKRIAELEAKR